MLLETCRYKVVDGKVTTKMFGMEGDDWDIEPGWQHSPKDAKAVYKADKWNSVCKFSPEVGKMFHKEETPKKIDMRTKEGRELKAQQNGDSSGSD